MFNPTMMAIMARVQQERLLEEARRSSIPEALRNTSPRLREQLFVRIGGVLISAGVKLQARYRPATYPGLEGCR